MSFHQMRGMETFFRGGVLLVYLLDPTEMFTGGLAIQDPELTDINGRTFIRGKVPAHTEDWSAGQPIGVALDQVAHYLEFADEQEFMEKVYLGFHQAGTA
ncbi:MAG: hypothetical protein ACLFRG_15500 [Desulfococcaceae bacterium]